MEEAFEGDGDREPLVDVGVTRMDESTKDESPASPTEDANIETDTPQDSDPKSPAESDQQAGQGGPPELRPGTPEIEKETDQLQNDQGED